MSLVVVGYLCYCTLDSISRMFRFKFEIANLIYNTHAFIVIINVCGLAEETIKFSAYVYCKFQL